MDCPKCGKPLQTLRDKSRECQFCGLSLPPYPLPREYAGCRRGPDPDTRQLALSVFKRLDNNMTLTARAIGVPRETLRGWLHGYAKKIPRTRTVKVSDGSTSYQVKISITSTADLSIRSFKEEE